MFVLADEETLRRLPAFWLLISPFVGADLFARVISVCLGFSNWVITTSQAPHMIRNLANALLLRAPLLKVAIPKRSIVEKIQFGKIDQNKAKELKRCEKSLGHLGYTLCGVLVTAIHVRF